MRRRWSRRAEDDTARIVEHIAKENPRTAINVGDTIERSISQLKSFPEMGRRGRVPGTRELVISGLPFIAIYRARASIVQIARVLHGAQQWPPEVGR